jgi:hypothetical protein
MRLAFRIALKNRGPSWYGLRPGCCSTTTGTLLPGSDLVIPSFFKNFVFGTALAHEQRGRDRTVAKLALSFIAIGVAFVAGLGGCGPSYDSWSKPENTSEQY